MNKTNKTLVAITFYERKRYLSRILNYYNQFEDDLDIIILDQSKETWDAKSHPKIKGWHHFPSDKFNLFIGTMMMILPLPLESKWLKTF